MTSPSQFGEWTASVLQRLDLLHQRASAAAPEEQELLSEAIEELHASLEELNSTVQELAAARDTIDEERGRYFELFELAPDGYLVTDPDSVIREANRAAYELFSIPDPFPPNYLVGKPMAGFIARSSGRMFRKALMQAREGEPLRDVEIMVRRNGASALPVALTVTPARDRYGATVGLRWMLRDLSAFKRAEQARAQLAGAEERARLAGVNAELYRQAEREREQLEAVLEQTPEGIQLFNTNGQVTHQNRAARRLLEPLEAALQQPADRESVPLADLLSLSAIHPNGQPYDAASLPLAAALRGETVLGAEVAYPAGRADARVVMLINAAPIRSAGGSVDGAVVVMQDITALKQLEHLKDEFLSLAAHELKTPLTTIKGNSQLLLRHHQRGQLHLSEADSETLRLIDEKTNYAVSLVNELLDLSRAETGKLQMTLGPMDLAAQLRTLVRQQQQVRPDRAIILEGCDEPVCGSWDPGRLDQVFTNLLDNAAKYSGAPSEIRMALRRQNQNWIEVTVEDHGVGIPSEELTLIFDRHHRGSNVGRDTSGLGLGLYLSQQIVERHGGRIWAESVEGSGATFHVLLPGAACSDQCLDGNPG